MYGRWCAQSVPILPQLRKRKGRTMRAMLVTTLLSTMLAMSVATSALSAECTHSLTFRIAAEDDLQDVAHTNGHPVEQNILAANCGKLSGDVFTSTDLTKGRYFGQEHQTSEEIDLPEIAWTQPIYASAKFGEFSAQAYFGYYFLDLGKGLNIADDYIQLSLEGAWKVPVSYHGWHATLFARPIHNLPVGIERPLDWLRAGARFDGPLKLQIFGPLNSNFEVAPTSNFNTVGEVPHRQVWRGEVDFSKPVGKHWVLGFGVQYTEYLGFTPRAQATVNF